MGALEGARAGPVWVGYGATMRRREAGKRAKTLGKGAYKARTGGYKAGEGGV